MIRASCVARSIPAKRLRASYFATLSQTKANDASVAQETASHGKATSTEKKTPRATFDALHDLSLHAEAHTQRVVIDAVGPTSFTVSGVRVRGSLLLLPHLATFWNVNRITDICADAFALVKLHTPRPDMLLLGTGSAVHPVSPDLYSFFRQIGVRFDVLDTKNACHTFNVLNQEGRLVAAALVPTAVPGPSRPGRSAD